MPHVSDSERLVDLLRKLREHIEEFDAEVKKLEQEKITAKEGQSLRLRDVKRMADSPEFGEI